jgi:Urease accessory protein UreH
MQDNIPQSFQDYNQEEVDQLPSGSPGKDGIVEAVFTAGNDGVTNVSHQYACPPFHLMGDLHHDEQLQDLSTLYIQNPSGGVTQGDRHKIDVKVQSGAQANVSTQSSTKVYGMEKNLASSSTEIFVNNGGYLEFMPDPTILYKKSRFFKNLKVTLERGSTLLLSDIVVPGRLARDEFFEFDKYHSKVNITYGNNKIFANNYVLNSESIEPDRDGLMKDFRVIGTMNIISDKFDSDKLNSKVYNNVNQLNEITAASSVLPYNTGIVLKILGDTAQSVQDAINHAWNEARNILFNKNKRRDRTY